MTQPETTEIVYVDQETVDDLFLKEIETRYEETSEYDDAMIEQMVAQPERDSNPQTDWPESEPNGTVTVEQYLAQLNWRLTHCGYMLDAARSNIDDDQYDKWLELKGIVALAKAEGDPYKKVDVVIAIESEVYDFASRVGVNESEYRAVQ